MTRIARVLILAGLLGVLPRPAVSQEFGKNTVRAREHRWSVVESEHVFVHFYGDTAAALEASDMAEAAYARLSTVLGHEMSQRIPLILYANPSDFQETNVFDGPLDAGTGGVTEFLRRRVVLPLTGSRSEFRHVLTHELVHAFQIDILFGGEGNRRLNPLSFHVPLWVMEGMAEYLSLSATDAQTAMWVGDGCLGEGLPSLERLAMARDIRVYRYGQSIWGEIARSRGDAVCGEALRAIVRTKSVEEGLESAFGASLDDVGQDWIDAMRCEYLPLVAEREPARSVGRLVAGGNRGEPLALTPAISPDGTQVAYFSDRDLTFSLVIADLETGRVLDKIEGESTPGLEELRAFSSGIAWSPDGATIAFTAKGASDEALLLYDVGERRLTRHVLAGLDEVRSPAFSPDGSLIAVVGVRGPESDLYLYDPRNRGVVTVTNDPYVERSPAFSPDGTTLVFATDRVREIDPPDAAPQYGPERLAVIDLETRRMTLLPSLGTKAVSPLFTPSGEEILFVSDPEGFSDLFLLRPATGQLSRATRLLTGVQGILPTSACLSRSADGSRLVFTALDRGVFGIYLADGITDRAVPFSPPAPVIAEAIAPPDPAPAPDSTSDRTDDKNAWVNEYDPDIYDEETLYAEAAMPAESDIGPEGPAAEVSDAAPAARAAPEAASSEESGGEDDARLPVIRPYRPRFAPDYFVGGGAFGTAGAASGASAVGFSDLLGNHRIQVGLGIYGSLKNSDIALGYENRTGRTGWGVSAFREARSYRRVADGYFSTSEGEYVAGGRVAFDRPASRYTRVELSMTLGEMNEMYRTRWEAAPPSPADGGQRYRFATAGVALVNDTIVWGMTGPVKGRRFRLSAEATGGELESWALRGDVRRYLRPARSLVLATRVVGGVRGGATPDSWHLGATTLVHGLRWGQLVGTRMAAASVEARFPFVRTLALGFPLPIRFDDIGGAVFADAGAAWTDEFTNGGRDAGRALSSNLLGAYGAGIRANLGFAVLRFDVAQLTNGSVPIGQPQGAILLGAEY